MKNYILACCVESVESALAAKRGGANRLELCSGLIIGGLSPSRALFETIRENVDICTHVLLRPRFGDFYYTEHEHEILKKEVKMFRELGADGIVIGTLQSDGSLNIDQMKELIEQAGDMSITLHRAFDMCKDPFTTLKQAKELGIHTILTSGQKNQCIDGIELLAELVKESDGQIDILIGGGVDGTVIEELYQKTGSRTYHMSGKVTLDSEMKYRKADVNMGIASMSEYEICRTSAERISKAKSVLEKL